MWPFLISIIFLGHLDELQILYRIAWVFSRFQATRAVALYISKSWVRVCRAALLHKLKSLGISCQVFKLILSFLSNRRLQMAQDGKFLPEYRISAGVFQGSILGLTFALH